jgi:hypothetical protein
MQPLTLDEIQRALDEAAHSGNFFLLSAIRRMASELRELRDQHATARFLQDITPSF